MSVSTALRANIRHPASSGRLADIGRDRKDGPDRVVFGEPNPYSAFSQPSLWPPSLNRCPVEAE